MTSSPSDQTPDRATRAVADSLRRIGDRVVPPRVRALHLPPARPGDPDAGESCAVELEDGSIGLSYVLYGDTLPALRRLPSPAGADPLAVAAGIERGPRDADGMPRTLGFAAAGAVTAWLYRQAGFEPPSATDSLAGIEPRPGEAVGMVGWFGPLVPRMVAAGARLTVLELRTELHGNREGATVTGDPGALAGCTAVLCTGTALLNATLDGLVAAAPRATRFALIGPTAGVLPDGLFASGVTAVGGSWIVDGPAFVDALRRGEPRGPSARKVLQRADDHPGLEALLGRLR